MIVKELYTTRKDGVKLYKVYSDADYYIRQIETGNIYEYAIDVETATYTYEETQDKLDLPEVKYSTLKIIRTLGDEWLTYKAMLEEARIS